MKIFTYKFLICSLVKTFYAYIAIDAKNVFFIAFSICSFFIFTAISTKERTKLYVFREKSVNISAYTNIIYIENKKHCHVFRDIIDEFIKYKNQDSKTSI